MKFKIWSIKSQQAAWGGGIYFLH